MTDQDRKAARREIADALLKALERRHEVADVVVESENKAVAVEAIVNLLDTSHLAAEAVMSMSFDRLTIDSRKQILAELEDLNKQLSFTVGERPASSGDTLELLAFSADRDRDVFATRTSDMGAAGDGSGGPAGSLDDEIGAAQARVTTKRLRGSWPSIRARRSEWCSASSSTARWMCGSGFIRITVRRATGPPPCVSRGRRWPGASPPCRWLSGRPGLNLPNPAYFRSLTSARR